VGYDGTGTFTVGGGVLNVENRIELGGSNEVDPGDGTTITSAGSGSLLVTSGTINENNSGIYVGVAEESTGNLFEMTGGTVTTGGNGLDMAKGANSDATVNIKDGSLIINDGGFFMAMGTGSSTTVQIGYADGSGNPSVYVGDDNYEIGNKGTAVYTQWSGSVVQDGGSGTDNLVVTQDAGSDGTFNLYGGVFDLRAPGDQAGDTNGEVNFNRGVGTATIEGRNGQTARLYVPNKFQLTNQSTGASIVNIDTGGEVHVQGGIDYRSGGMVDAVNLKGGLLNFYGDGATIDQRDLDDQFNWTGGRMQNLTTWNGHQGGAAYVQEDLGKGGDREGVLGDASPTATTGAGSGTAGGLLFDGDQDYVNFGNGVNMFNGQSEVALSIWFRRDGDQATQTNHNINNVLVAQSGGGSNNDNFEIGSDGDNIEFYLDVGSGPANETMSVDTSGAGGIGTTWHHVVLSYDGTAGLDVWFDNNQILTGDTSFSGAFAASGSNAPLTLGIARPGSDDWGDFLGAMDEFAFWHETLDAAGVADLYNGGSGNQLAAALATAEFYASLDTVYISQWLQQDAGVMAPGASIGTTTVNDNYDVGNNDPATATTSADPLAAVWEIELDPDTAIGSAGGRTQYDADFIDVNGTLTLAADSVLSLIDITGSDFAGLTSDHVFIIAEYDELDGTFGAVEGLPASLVDYNFDDANQIAIMPEPATLALTGLGATATLLARRRRRRA